MNFDNLHRISSLFHKLASIRSQTFDLSYFKTLNDPEEILAYAEEHLQNADPDDEFGTSRGVFILNSKWVLKIALPENLGAGIAQNRNEKVFSEQLGDIVTRVSDSHPNDLWIRSELVRPVFDLEELMPLLGIDDPRDMMYLFGKFPDKKMVSSNPSATALAVSKLVRSGILHFDAQKSDSWGITADGRPVLLDYGMTPSVYQEHYKKK